MKYSIAILLLTINFSLNAQVGIGTTTPNATLDVVGDPSTTSSMDGIIPPRLTGNQLNSKTYTTTQEGAIIYATSPLSDSDNGQCANVTTTGLYSFNGTLWQSFTNNNTNNNNSLSTLNDVDVTTNSPNIGDKLVWDGTNWSTERSFFASVSGRDTGSFSNSFTTYVSPTIDSDNSGSYNSSNGTITLPYDGLYLIQGTLRVFDDSDSGTQFGVGVHTSNADGPWFLWHAVMYTDNSLDRTTYPYSRIARFNANDALRMFVYVQNGPLDMATANFSVYKLSD